MKFKVLTGTVTDVKNISTDDDGNITDYIPTFKKGYYVQLKPEFINYNSSNKLLSEGKYKVHKCKLSNLGNMITEVIYLEEVNTVNNPYLASHFKGVKIHITDDGTLK